MVFCLDDGTVCGSLALLDEVVARLRALLPTVDLRLNSQKSLLTASAVDTFTHLSQLSLVDPSDDNNGFRVLGVPPGGKNYVQTELQKLSATVREFCSKVLRLHHPQASLTLQQLCCGTCRVTHLLRGRLAPR